MTLPNNKDEATLTLYRFEDGVFKEVYNSAIHKNKSIRQIVEPRMYVRPHVVIVHPVVGDMTVQVLNGDEELELALRSRFDMLTYVQAIESDNVEYINAHKACLEDLVIAQIYNTYVELIDGINILPHTGWGEKHDHIVVVKDCVVIYECVSTGHVSYPIRDVINVMLHK